MIDIYYKKSVEKDFKKIDHKNRNTIKNKIENKLSKEGQSGKPLTGRYKGLFSMRVGDYRVVYCIIEKGLLILRIARRDKSYR